MKIVTDMDYLFIRGIKHYQKHSVTKIYKSDKIDKQFDKITSKDGQDQMLVFSKEMLVK